MSSSAGRHSSDGSHFPASQWFLSFLLLFFIPFWCGGGRTKWKNSPATRVHTVDTCFMLALLRLAFIHNSSPTVESSPGALISFSLGHSRQHFFIYHIKVVIWFALPFENVDRTDGQGSSSRQATGRESVFIEPHFRATRDGEKFSSDEIENGPSNKANGL